MNSLSYVMEKVISQSKLEPKPQRTTSLALSTKIKHTLMLLSEEFAPESTWETTLEP